MIIMAAILTAAISVDIDLSSLLQKRQVAEPNVTCGISTIGYRFIGRPGQQFRYAGDVYQIPSDGWVELIADKRRKTYSVNGRSLPLDVWPQNQFGFREVPLPSSTNQGETS